MDALSRRRRHERPTRHHPPGGRALHVLAARAGLAPYLEMLGSYLVGYGCTTCIGNSGPLPEEIAYAIAGTMDFDLAREPLT